MVRFKLKLSVVLFILAAGVAPAAALPARTRSQAKSIKYRYLAPTGALADAITAEKDLSVFILD